MRIFLNIRNKGNIESDDKVSKSNCRSRAWYSTEDEILEKRLVFDNSLLVGKHTIYAMTDLQACYDRQLSKIGSIVQESVGVETKPIQFVTKMLPIKKHHVSTDFGVSKECYWRRGETLAGIGKGNVVSVKMCRDSSWIMLRDIEKETLGNNNS